MWAMIRAGFAPSAGFAWPPNSLVGHPSFLSPLLRLLISYASRIRHPILDRPGSGRAVGLRCGGTLASKSVQLAHSPYRGTRPQPDRFVGCPYSMSFAPIPLRIKSEERASPNVGGNDLNSRACYRCTKKNNRRRPCLSGYEAVLRLWIGRASQHSRAQSSIV